MEMVIPAKEIYGRMTKAGKPDRRFTRWHLDKFASEVLLPAMLELNAAILEDMKGA